MKWSGKIGEFRGSGVYVQATFLILIGLFYNPFLMLIAFFVWIGAAQEASKVQMKSARVTV